MGAFGAQAVDIVGEAYCFLRVVGDETDGGAGGDAALLQGVAQVEGDGKVAWFGHDGLRLV